MTVGTCNKCGNRKELVLAGCVCAGCSDALDRQWGNSTAIDWVLIASTIVTADIVMQELKAAGNARPG
jgi:hypothetical protein